LGWPSKVDAKLLFLWGHRRGEGKPLLKADHRDQGSGANVLLVTWETYRTILLDAAASNLPG
jgi:hypothetical protein